MSQELTNAKNTSSVNVVNELQHASNKRYNAVLPKRGGRKKTLSLNPEEREALENLVEEVIIDGGMGDSESGSSDDDESVRSNTSPSKNKSFESSQSGTAPGSGDQKSTSYKTPKKYYPGQLKVALKHMTDLPPRFSRKLKKAEKYLEINAMHKKTMASSSIKEEDEDESSNVSTSTTSTSTPNSTSRTMTSSSGQEDTSPSSAADFNSLNASFNCNNNSSSKQKTFRDRPQKVDLKKTIRSLLMDLDQYVDENDRSSISLDLPGAVSCSDLEKDSLQSNVSTQHSNYQSSSQNLDQNNNTRNFSLKANLEHSPIYCDSKAKKNLNGNLTMANERNVYNYASKLLPSYYHPVSTLQTSFPMHSPSTHSNKSFCCSNVSMMSGSGSGSSSFNQSDINQSKFKIPEYSPMTSGFMEANEASFVMPVTQLVPSLIPPNLTFPQSPPGSFAYSTPPSHYVTPNQLSFDSGSIKYDPQFGGYVDYSMAGIVCPPLNNILTGDVVRPNYPVGFQMTPVVFQQFNSPQQPLPSGFSYPNNSPNAFLNQFSYPPPSLPSSRIQGNSVNQSQKSVHQSMIMPNVLNLDLSVATSNFQYKTNNRNGTSTPSNKEHNNHIISPVTNFNKTSPVSLESPKDSSAKSKKEVLKSEIVGFKPRMMSISTPSLIMGSDALCEDSLSDVTKKGRRTPIRSKEETNYLKTTFAQDIGIVKALMKPSSVCELSSKKTLSATTLLTSSPRSTQVTPGLFLPDDSSGKGTAVKLDLPSALSIENPELINSKSFQSYLTAKSNASETKKQLKHQLADTPLRSLNNLQPSQERITNQSNHTKQIMANRQPNLNPKKTPSPSVGDVTVTQPSLSNAMLVQKLDVLINGTVTNDIPVDEKKSDIQLLNLSMNPNLGHQSDDDNCTGFIVKLDDGFINKLINLFIKDKNDGRDEEIKLNIKKKMRDEVFLNKDLLKEIFNLLSTNKETQI